MNFDYNPNKVEVLGALPLLIPLAAPALYFFDFGFPDKRMTDWLNDFYPNDKWTRSQVSDLYDWYKEAVKEGAQKPWDVDGGMSANSHLIKYLQNTTPFSNDLVLHWAVGFKTGLQQRWIDPKYAGVTKSSENPVSKVLDALKNIGKGIPSVTDVTYLLLAAGGLIGAWYLFPVVARGAKKIQKRKK